MTRLDIRPFLAVLVIVATCLFAGCGSSTTTQTVGASAARSARARPARPARPAHDARLERFVVRELRKQATRGERVIAANCPPPRGGDTQCAARVHLRDGRDHAFGVALRVTANGGEAAVEGMWDEGAISTVGP
jgi:hypothetical protein